MKAMEPANELVERISTHAKDLDAEIVRAFLGRFEEDYAGAYDAETIASHLSALAKLSADNPVAVITEEKGKRIVCTIVAFDHPFEFSSITGMLAATGFSVEGGDAFTLAKVKANQPRKPVRRREDLTARKRDP